MTPPRERDPEPGFERAIAELQRGQLTQRDLMLQMLSTLLWVPSGADFRTNPGAFRPVLIRQKGVAFMAVYTAKDRAIEQQKKIAPYLAELSGRDILAGLDVNVGLAVNPSYNLGFTLPPVTVAEVIADVLG